MAVRGIPSSDDWRILKWHGGTECESGLCGVCVYMSVWFFFFGQSKEYQVHLKQGMFGHVSVFPTEKFWDDTETVFQIVFTFQICEG